MKKTKNKRYSGFVLACLAPAMVLFTVFMIIPTVNVFPYVPLQMVLGTLAVLFCVILVVLNYRPIG